MEDSAFSLEKNHIIGIRASVSAYRRIVTITELLTLCASNAPYPHLPSGGLFFYHFLKEKCFSSVDEKLNLVHNKRDETERPVALPDFYFNELVKKYGKEFWYHMISRFCEPKGTRSHYQLFLVSVVLRCFGGLTKRATALTASMGISSDPTRFTELFRNLLQEHKLNMRSLLQSTPFILWVDQYKRWHRLFKIKFRLGSWNHQDFTATTATIIDSISKEEFKMKSIWGPVRYRGLLDLGDDELNLSFHYVMKPLFESETRRVDTVYHQNRAYMKTPFRPPGYYDTEAFERVRRDLSRARVIPLLLTTDNICSNEGLNKWLIWLEAMMKIYPETLFVLKTDQGISHRLWRIAYAPEGYKPGVLDRLIIVPVSMHLRSLPFDAIWECYSDGFFGPLMHSIAPDVTVPKRPTLTQMCALFAEIHAAYDVDLDASLSELIELSDDKTVTDNLEKIRFLLSWAIPTLIGGMVSLRASDERAERDYISKALLILLRCRPDSPYITQIIFSQAQYMYWTEIAKIDIVKTLLSKFRHFDNEESHEASLAILSAFAASAPPQRTNSAALARQFVISPVVAENLRALELIGDVSESTASSSSAMPAPSRPGKDNALSRLNLLFNPKNPSVITDSTSKNIPIFKDFITKHIANIANGTGRAYQKPAKGNYPRKSKMTTRPLNFLSVNLSGNIFEMASVAFNRVRRLMSRSRPGDAIQPSTAKTTRASGNMNTVKESIESYLRSIKSEPGYSPYRFIPRPPRTQYALSEEDAMDDDRDDLEDDFTDSEEVEDDDDDASDDDDVGDTDAGVSDHQTGNSSRVSYRAKRAQALWDSGSEGEFNNVFRLPTDTAQSGSIDLYGTYFEFGTESSPPPPIPDQHDLFAGVPTSRAEFAKRKQEQAKIANRKR